MAQTTAEFLIEQGKAEGKQDAVLKLLHIRFQDVPEVLSREISNIHNLCHSITRLKRNFRDFTTSQLTNSELQTIRSDIKQPIFQSSPFH